MTVLTSFPNGGKLVDFRETFNALLLDVAAMKAAAPDYALKNVLKGDSIGAGYRASYSGFDHVLVAGVSLVNVSVSATTLEAALADAQSGEDADQIDATKPTNFVQERGTNDLCHNSTTAADLYYNYAVPLAALIRSLGGYATFETILARGATFDGWTPAKETERQSYNTMLKGGNDLLADFVLDSASRPEFANPDDTTYFADTLHLTNAGQDVKATLYTANAKLVGILPKRSPTVVIYGRPAAGTQGTAYDWTIPRVGGTGPFTFAVSIGALPSGLTLDSSTGAITGTPSGSGTFAGVEFSCTDTATGKTWKLSGRSFSVAAAASGTAVEPLAMSNATFAPGKFGSGLSGGSAKIPLSVLPETMPFPTSIEFWASTTSADLTVAVGSSVQDYGNWYVGSHGTAKAAVDVAGDFVDIDTTVAVADGLPHHYRAVFLAGGTKLYIDGALAGSINNAPTRSSQATIGFFDFAGGFPWAYGTIDELAIFNIDRSSAGLPSAPVAAGTAGLLAVYHLNGDGTGVK